MAPLLDNVSPPHPHNKWVPSQPAHSRYADFYEKAFLEGPGKESLFVITH